MSNNTVTLVDSHVHIYDCFDVAELFDAAYRNFSYVARSHGSDSFDGVLLLSETTKDHWFERLVEYAETHRLVGKWMFKQQPDDCCMLMATRSDQATLYVIAGRQIITAEKIEVLALATPAIFDDGQSLSATLDNVTRNDGLAVLPWAVGKWLGARRRLIQSVLHTHKEHSLRLGDNSGRPVFWRNPVLFRKANTLGIPILPGTDPLPLPWEADRVGSFGFILRQSLSEKQPTEALKRLLKQSDLEFEPYGSLDSSVRFIRNQIALRFGKR